MFRKVSVPKQPVSEVTQEVIMSVSKTLSLTFLHSDMGATRVTRRDVIRVQLVGVAGDTPPSWPQGESGGWETGLSSPLAPSDTSEHLGDNACERVLIHTYHTHMHTPTAHSYVYPHMCTQLRPHIEWGEEEF